MTKLIERLFIYLSVLEDYSFPASKERFTENGFCWHFCQLYDLDIYRNFRSTFPELYTQKTEDWPLYGDTKERRKMLERAIKLTIQKIEK